jgi:hypothetical protein
VVIFWAVRFQDGYVYPTPKSGPNAGWTNNKIRPIRTLYFVSEGCTDELALNYDENATQDNGSCVSVLNSFLDLPEGWSMFGYTCLDSVDAMVGFSSISDKIEIVKDESGLTYLPSWDFNAMGSFHFSEGYQIKMIEEVTDFEFCSTIVGGASQEELDAAYDNGVASVDITSDNADVYAEGAASVTPEDGITQSDVDAAVAEGPASFAASLSLGDFYQGGIVFQINEDGTGIVSAQVDLGVVNHTFEWGCYGTSTDGADGTAIGTGYQNTLDIVADWTEIPIAASLALAKLLGGYDDWYLPSIEELELMYNTIGQGADNSGNFENDHYWSSSEYWNTYAWNVNFGNGNSYNYPKYSSYRVRIIRAF